MLTDASPLEHIAKTSGKLGEVLHDTRMMIQVNRYNITNRIINLNNNSLVQPLGNKFLTVDLSIRSIEHTLILLPDLFNLKTDTGDIVTPNTVFTSLVEAGLRHMYMPANQTVRFLLVFDAPSFGSTATATPTLGYSDGTSSFTITLENNNILSQPNLLASVGLKSASKTGELMKNDSLQLIAKKVMLSSSVANNNLLKISLTFQNIGKFTIHIDASYVFILDNKSYSYGIVPYHKHFTIIFINNYRFRSR
ncbi:MAG: hypothetical protein WAM14_18280 [Candidatus Nitrosopolaris sp.]